MAVRVQQVVAQRVLTSDIDAETPVYFGENFDNQTRPLQACALFKCLIEYSTMAVRLNVLCPMKHKQ